MPQGLPDQCGFWDAHGPPIGLQHIGASLIGKGPSPDSVPGTHTQADPQSPGPDLGCGVTVVIGARD
jgi:hypothetical protein